MSYPLLISLDNFTASVADQSIRLFTLYAPNKNAFCQITNFGARIVAMQVPDKAGQFVEVLEGYSKLESYQNDANCFTGAILGRCANTIAAGIFVLDGKTYALDINEEQNTLNGGPNGLHSQVWNVLKTTPQMLALQFLLKEEIDGFPGNLDVEVVFEWVDEEHFRITYHAHTDKATLVNLTNQVVFHLSGEEADQELLINAAGFIEINERGIPSGKILEVENSPFDFRRSLKMSAAIENNHPQMSVRKGLDHVFVLENQNPGALLYSPSSGISLAIESDQPGMFIKAEKKSKDKPSKQQRPFKESVILAPQGYPDAIHHPYFPSSVLRLGEVFHSTTTYHFSVI